jgi:hypothetical protein
MNSEFVELFAALNAHRVRYLLVGGYAVIHYAEPRYTKDIDVLVEPTRRNAQRAYRAIVEFTGPLTSIDESTLAEPGIWLKLGRPPVRIDILTSIPAVRFSTAWKNRARATYGAQPIHVISRKDLMRNKRAAGRPQDLLDLEAMRSSGR